MFVVLHAVFVPQSMDRCNKEIKLHGIPTFFPLGVKKVMLLPILIHANWTNSNTVNNFMPNYNHNDDAVN